MPGVGLDAVEHGQVLKGSGAPGLFFRPGKGK